MNRVAQNRGFVCRRCGLRVVPLSNGSYRNHCPRCLWSRHVDVHPGDRASDCGGLMRPTAIEHRSGKGLVIVHTCIECGHTRANRIADDPVQGDDPLAMSEVMRGL